MDVFDKFVRDFESRLNQLRLVEMGVKVSKEIDSMFNLTPTSYQADHGVPLPRPVYTFNISH